MLFSLNIGSKDTTVLLLHYCPVLLPITLKSTENQDTSISELVGLYANSTFEIKQNVGNNICGVGTQYIVRLTDYH